MKNWLSLILCGVILSSCASLNQSLNIEEDDIYYTNDFQHRLNRQALLMNKQVAMPDSAYEYFDETYAESIRPSYAKQFRKFDSQEGTDTYFDENDLEENNSMSSQSESNSRWLNNVSMGIAVGSYYGANAYYGGGPQVPFYSAYNAPTSRYYPGSNYYSARSTRPYSSEVYRPYVAPGNNRLNTGVQGYNSQTKPYINRQNVGFNAGNSNRQYRTRSSQNNGVWSSPGYYNGSRSGGGYSPSGTVRGYQRR